MKQHSKKLFSILFLVIIFSLGVWFYKTNIFQKPFFYLGTVEATTVTLSARLPSPIKNIEVKEGDTIQKEQILLNLLCDDINLNFDIAQKEYTRAQRLYKQAIIATENYDRIQNKAEEMKMKLDWCQIKAPINGTLLQRYYEPGEWVSAGTKLLTLANLDELYAFIYVEAPYLAQLQLGQELPIYVAELGRKQIIGKISIIQEEAQFIPKNVQTREERLRLVHGIKISFPNLDRLIKPGMTVEVELPKDRT